MYWQLPIGAQYDHESTRFRVWSPSADQVEVVFLENEIVISSQLLTRDEEGYWVGTMAGVQPGTLYMYRLDGDKLRPDPASRFQPKGVHGASQVVDPQAFGWSDSKWYGVKPEQVILYETHIGTATPIGSFKSFVEKLDYLVELGITTIEIMPIADFPGERGWGYDGVYPYAPATCYGHPDNFKLLVNEAHQRGLAVILDVVYNHFGPDGCYLRDFSQAYLTDTYKTPWGDGINYESAPVRQFFIQNALYWAHEYHLDGLRLDATHAMQDPSPLHLLAELKQRVQASLPEERQFLIYAEDDRNDSILLRATDAGGYNLDGMWADDYHHQIRVALTVERDGYYRDYSGTGVDIATTINDGWFYQGQYSEYAEKVRGTPSEHFAPYRYVHCIQNHDQIGNRALGDRLNHKVSMAAYRAASALLLMGSATPLLFQGQEWAASTAWQYFTDHNPQLGKLVSEGRRAEFAQFSAFANTEIPDPQELETFLRSKLNWDESLAAPHLQILNLYRNLLAFRRQLPVFQEGGYRFKAYPLFGHSVALRYYNPDGSDALLVMANLSGDLEYELLNHPETAPSRGQWQLWSHSEEAIYGGDTALVAFDQADATIKFSTPCTMLLIAK